MRTRHARAWRLLAAPALVLALTACGSDTDTAGEADGATEADAATDDGAEHSDEPITVGSFNFPESTILAEIYAQALEEAGLPVERELDIGARELIYPDLEQGTIDLLPEYLGSALAVRFEGEPTADVDANLQALRDELEAVGLAAFDPSDAEDKNVFVVTSAFAESEGVSSVADLADAGDIAMGGPPECEERSTCYAGLQEAYGLDNLSFQTLQETPIRVESLANDEIQVALLFSTDPIIAERDFVVLDDPEGVVAAENVVPVATQEVVDAHGDALADVLDEISAALTTDALLEMNGQANAGDDAADIARQWLEDNGLIG